MELPAIGVVVTLRVAPADAEPFEAIMHQLCADVTRSEPGTLIYRFCRVDAEPGVYRVIEAYADDEARMAHRHGAALKAHGPRFLPMLTGKPSVDDQFTVLA